MHLGLAKRITRWVKKKSKILTRNSAEVKRGALKMAKDNAIHAIFCGHTHMSELNKTDGIVYGNSGTFESDIPSYIAINQDSVSLYRWQDGKSTLISAQSI